MDVQVGQSPRRPIELRCDLAPADPVAVVAESRALLAGRAQPDGVPCEVPHGTHREVLRLYTVADCVAFGPRDEQSPGYARALEVAGEAGFRAVSRVEGGRAIAAGPGVLGIAWTLPGGDGRARIRPRFSLLASVIADSLRALEVEADVGPVAGEYCPGAFSIGALAGGGGRVKLAGLGQRVTGSGTHLGAFVVLEGARRLRAVLAEVNAALEIDWAPSTLGSVRAVAGRSITVADLAGTLVTAFGDRFDLEATTARTARGNA